MTTRMEPRPSPSGEGLLVARNLVKVFGHLTAVNNIDLVVRPGEVMGLLGPNGAGKTTTINMCTGLLRPTSGTIHISGLDVQRDARIAKRLIGYVPDEPYLYDKLTSREFVTFMGRLYGVTRHLAKRVDELLAYFGLADVADDLIGGYSHGMKQKTALAGVLIHDPLLLFLDEPTVGLDPRSARLLKDTLQSLARQGRSVILSTHILEIAEAICDRVAILNHGYVIAEGTMEQLRQQHQAGRDETLEDIFLRLTGGADEESVVHALRSP